jgi:predicted nucleic-acid-binding Zn-ribbon protein
MEVRLLACPKCKGTAFEVYWVTVKDFYHNGKPLYFYAYKCVKCGWETHPRDEQQLRKLLISILYGEAREGFIFAET